MTDIRACTVTEANALYKSAGYSGRAAPGDLLTGAYRHDTLIAVARLVPCGESLLLRHLCTLPAYRQQGAARALCIWLRQHVRQTIIIFPLPELIGMYQSAGFRVIHAGHLPAELTSVWAQVQRKHPASLPMSSEIKHEPTE